MTQFRSNQFSNSLLFNRFIASMMNGMIASVEQLK